MEFVGAFTALVTPFRNGEVDEEAFRQFIEWQIEKGINGLVPCGTTGESATLSHAEHKRVIKICVDQVAKRVPVLAGAGSNNTREAIELAKEAKELNADGALLITPYYNKPTQRGLIEHFAAIAGEVSMPIVVYNVPGRTSVNLLPKTLAEISKRCPNIIGVKEATANLAQISDVLEYCGRDFTVLSGDDFTILPTLAIGGKGVISVISNVAPDKVATMISAYVKGDMTTAQNIHYELAPLCRAMFLETNPVPAKTALAKMETIPSAEVRLPLVPLTAESEATLDTYLRNGGFI
ncbi:4-hydroxy-tetrahydrodipicolinate synthase [Desulfovibrio inopinatus]|uniref:4-hydroxy-tetrahydrodipicolinate synthase n=1 Tax=Desulfovibrio inopinatus TaxID=102109 RepID=UPI00041B99F4|nr:4-hydroxy-tetrahydrodipicolinate synthase [Desulfovibrio inopinatus]